MVGRSGLSRRSLAGLAAAPALAAAGTRPVAAQAQATDAATRLLLPALKNAKGTSLVMLGTAGGPGPKPTRHQTSHVMLSNGAAYVLDCGVGVDDTVKVSAIVVEHPPVKPSRGYRFDFKDRSIAFSGDTAPLDAVATMAKGADVLVHEAMYLPAVEPEVKARLAQGQPGTLADFMAHMKADHTPAEDAGRIAQEAGVKALVLSHLTPAVASVSDETWRAAAAKHFKGEIIVAQDLMVI
jgi:ribonuclease BN (tRNA processing enzyme)